MPAKKEPTEADTRTTRRPTQKELQDRNEWEILVERKRLELQSAELAERIRELDDPERNRRRLAEISIAHDTRVRALRALQKLTTAAINQAKKGKPALLRLILRATK